MTGCSVLAAPDKFRGTATARQIVDAVRLAVDRHGGTTVSMPLADGGEGTLDAFGGPNRRSTVTGPSGTPVEAAWRFDEASGVAVIEMALASGLLLAGGAAHNDPVAATTRGTGELIAAATREGARKVVVGLGGSATTDGGRGAVDVLLEDARWAPSAAASDRPELVVCCDVDTPFCDAATTFGAQKGADPDTVDRLTARLQRVAAHYRSTYGIDVSEEPGAGAAGGLAGGLMVLGGVLRPGFTAVSEAVGFEDALSRSDVVVTGEGRLDEASFRGKVVGGVFRVARHTNKAVVAVVGCTTPGLEIPADLVVLNLTATFGAERAMHDTAATVTEILDRHLEAMTAR